MEGRPNLKLILILSLGFVLITSLSAIASSRAGKNFFANFGRASVATLNDISGKENLHLAAEIKLTPEPSSSVKTFAPKTKQTGSAQTISNITSSIIAAVASSQIVKTIGKLPAEIIAATTSATPPPVEKNPETNSTTTPAPVQESEGHIVISVIQIRSVNSTYNDFVALFNPGWKEKDISGWRICKKTKSGSEDSFKIFPSGSIIPAKGKFTWANSSSSFYLSVDANIWSSDTIASHNSVALFDGGCGGNKIDSVAWGDGANQYTEGAPLPNPDSGQLIQRKFNQDIPIDTGDNLNDFEIK